MRRARPSDSASAHEGLCACALAELTCRGGAEPPSAETVRDSDQMLNPESALGYQPSDEAVPSRGERLVEAEKLDRPMRPLHALFIIILRSAASRAAMKEN